MKEKKKSMRILEDTVDDLQKKNEDYLQRHKDDWKLIEKFSDKIDELEATINKLKSK